MCRVVYCNAFSPIFVRYLLIFREPKVHIFFGTGYFSNPKNQWFPSAHRDGTDIRKLQNSEYGIHVANQVLYFCLGLGYNAYIKSYV